MIRRLVGLSFLAVLAAVVFFTMRPAWVNAGRTLGLPSTLARWLNQHDRLSNFLAFTLLGLLALAVPARPRPAAPRRTAGDAWSREGTARLLLLAGVGLLLEGSQIWIPGRVFDWKDVWCGSGGLLFVWVLWQIKLRLAPGRF